MILFLAFLMVPIIEIALFIQVGGAIGLWPTLAIVVLTAVLGTWLVRTQGRLALGQLQASFTELNDPTEPLVNGAMILVAGALLLTPGFFTDAVGFALLMPPVRLAVFRYLKSRFTGAHFQMGAGQSAGQSAGPGHGQSRDQRPQTYDGGEIIEGEFEEIRPKTNPNRQSGWVEPPKRH